MSTNPLSTTAAWDAVVDGYRAELVPLFRRYAEDALRLAAPAPGARVLDVAAGPGTLALLAARRGARVTALDFSARMLEALRAEAAGLDVEAVEGDGQALPFADGAFDAAFSMFGLMFFPDRARGLAELRRVLAPGAPVVVSSWAPLDRAPLMRAVLEAVSAELSGPRTGPPAPLGEPDAVRAELSAAGFTAVEVHPVAHEVRYDSADAFWDAMVRSSAPVALSRREMGEARFAGFERGVRARLRAALGPGPVAGPWPALLGFGRRP